MTLNPCHTCKLIYPMHLLTALMVGAKVVEECPLCKTLRYNLHMDLPPETPPIGYHDNLRFLEALLFNKNRGNNIKIE